MAASTALHKSRSKVFSTFFEGAQELAEMFGYFENYTYMGPDSASRIELAKEIANEEFVPLREWLAQNSLESVK